MKSTLSNRDYILFRKYFYTFGIGQEVEYMRNANLIITIANYITGAVGGKPKKMTPADIYPQLSHDGIDRSNRAVDWDNIPDHTKRELIAFGMYTEDGEPTKKTQSN